MLRALERSVASAEQRLAWLTPQHAEVPTVFNNVTVDPGWHRDLLAELQRLRGSIYFQDGALDESKLSDDGRHQTPEDERSWHLVMLDASGRITACVWYLLHDQSVTPECLRVQSSALARDPEWSGILSGALHRKLATLRASDMVFIEIGGWAVAEPSRRTTEGLLLALAGFSLGRLLGGAFGLTTATVRHCSSTILRRIGGAPLKVNGIMIPKYYDPEFDCEMELLGFDSRFPGPQYLGVIDALRMRLANVPVIAARPGSAEIPFEVFSPAPDVARIAAAL